MRVVVEPADQGTPFCPHYDHCGGCSLQHLTEATYRQHKLTRLQRILDGAGLVADVLPLQSAPQASRRRTTLAASKTKSGELKLGYHPAQSHAVTDISTCPILVPELQSFITPLRNTLTAIQFKQANIALTYTPTGIDLQWLGDLAKKQRDVLAQAIQHLPQVCRISVADEALYTRTTPQVTFADINVHLPIGAFLQASREGEQLLQQEVLRLCRGEKVADLFSGLGTFAIPLARQGKQVTAADNATESLKALSQTGLVKVIERDLFKHPFSLDELNNFDSIILDPPRAGASAQVSALAKSKVPQIIYVSCNAQTFAQDAQVLIAGGYKLNTIQPVDQFLWATHLEIVAEFSR